MHLKLRAHVSGTTCLLENLLFDLLKRTSHQLFTVTNLKKLVSLGIFSHPSSVFQLGIPSWIHCRRISTNQRKIKSQLYLYLGWITSKYQLKVCVYKQRMRLSLYLNSISSTLICDISCQALSDGSVICVAAALGKKTNVSELNYTLDTTIVFSLFCH